ncbi:hypothetical protein ACEQPO_07170 [Bacillus sp. SL00103]
MTALNDEDALFVYTNKIGSKTTLCFQSLRTAKYVKRLIISLFLYVYIG